MPAGDFAEQFTGAVFVANLLAGKRQVKLGMQRPRNRIIGGPIRHHRLGRRNTGQAKVNLRYRRAFAALTQFVGAVFFARFAGIEQVAESDIKIEHISRR